ncbi:Nucleic acid-binding proteins protein [Dioscorea alata]|uniref:Nucleic acid-binding proteins protein n=1 Tax=Dioscorea alata TaxID=55571 RepID=A0ACB7WKJ1_DIOAL|nr:Nucleic acid-binding proteins protein [Dioscorea alata]
MRLNLMVKDETDEMNLVIFYKQAEKLTKTFLSTMPAVKDINRFKPPPLVLRVKVKEFCFTIRLAYKAATQGLKLYEIFDSEEINGKVNFTSPMKEEPQIEAIAISINQSRKKI